MKIYVVRHCATACSEQKIYCGESDVPLSPAGKEQASALAERLANIPIDLILCSPLLRARQTAEVIASGRNIPILYDDRLKERNFGAFEATDVEAEEGKACRYNFAVKYPGGESNLQVAARVYALLGEAVQRFRGKDLLILSHGSVCRLIRTYFREMTDAAFYAYSQPNGAIEEYEPEEECGNDRSSPRIHTMELSPAPFAMMKSGQKKIEMRLYDEKRKRIRAGDEIVFTNAESGETLRTLVLRTDVFPSFAALYRALPLLDCGYTAQTLSAASAKDMEQFYPVARQERYGVVGIRITLL